MWEERKGTELDQTLNTKSILSSKRRKNALKGKQPPSQVYLNRQNVTCSIPKSVRISRKKKKERTRKHLGERGTEKIKDHLLSVTGKERMDLS